MGVINVLIVDDERKACTNLKNLLAEYVGPQINVVGMANSTREAEAMIGKFVPDALFLDIEMPNENAFMFLERLWPLTFEVIFVTAYDDYAVHAFRLNAVDYILKPISIPELRNAVNKLVQKLEIRSMISDAQFDFRVLAGQLAARQKLYKITLRDAGTIELVDFRDIFFVEAMGSYSRFVFNKDKEGKEIILSNPLSEYEELLPADLFYRIHRSYLVNCGQIRNIDSNSPNQVVMKNGMSLPISRRRLVTLIDFLKHNDFVYE